MPQRADSSRSAVLAASTVGLLGSPLGQGSLLRAATLYPVREARIYVRRVRNEATLAASTVGLLASPTSYNPLLRAATLSPELQNATEFVEELLDGVGSSEDPEAAPRARLMEPQTNTGGAPASNSSAEADSWMVPALFGVVAIVLVCVGIGRSISRAAGVARVRIAAVPPGEAPEYIRRAWIGLELPVANGSSERGQGVVGVLSNRSAACGDGYAVDGAEAVELLAAHAPNAAVWWCTNAPHVLVGGYQLVFPAEVCEAID